jgi:hypothetical protein
MTSHDNSGMPVSRSTISHSTREARLLWQRNEEERSM